MSKVNLRSANFTFIEYNSFVGKRFFNERTKKRLVKVFFRVLLAYLIVCWIIMAVFFAGRIIERRYSILYLIEKPFLNTLIIMELVGRLFLQ